MQAGIFPEKILEYDIIRVADAMGYDVKLCFVDRETGKEIECD